jgi:hypothetical protein
MYKPHIAHIGAHAPRSPVAVSRRFAIPGLGPSHSGPVPCASACNSIWTKSRPQHFAVFAVRKRCTAPTCSLENGEIASNHGSVMHFYKDDLNRINHYLIQIYIYVYIHVCDYIIYQVFHHIRRSCRTWNYCAPSIHHPEPAAQALITALTMATSGSYTEPAEQQVAGDWSMWIPSGRVSPLSQFWSV